MNRLCLALAMLVSTIASASAVHAEGGANLPPVADSVTVKECGACHIPYQPQMLPARSWRAIMADLGNHFGDNATLPDKTRSQIEAYLVANAADAPASMSYGWRFLRGIPPDATPLRITETSFWNRAHSEISDAVFSDPKVKLRSNCVACHTGARQGRFGEEE